MSSTFWTFKLLDFISASLKNDILNLIPIIHIPTP